MSAGNRKDQTSTAKQKRRHFAKNPGKKRSSKTRTKLSLSRTRKNHRSPSSGRPNQSIRRHPKETTTSLVLDISEKSTTEGLLKQLGDESLKRSHQSVLISFEQMLAYIDKIRKPVKHEHIRLLLDTYRDMAEEYYRKY